jgi:hypothetical protein
VVQSGVSAGVGEAYLLSISLSGRAVNQPGRAGLGQVRARLISLTSRAELTR